MRTPEVSFVDLVRQELEIAWTGAVHVLAQWDDTNDRACFVYSKPADPTHHVLGRVFAWGPHVADGTREGAAIAGALALAEPPGALWENAKVDRDGIRWLGLGDEAPPPVPRSCREAVRSFKDSAF